MGTSSAWTPERRQRQAEIIRETQPWLKSTGPRSDAGKQISAMNAASLHKRRLKALDAVAKNLRAQLRMYRKIAGIRRNQPLPFDGPMLGEMAASDDDLLKMGHLIFDGELLQAEALALFPEDPCLTTDHSRLVRRSWDELAQQVQSCCKRRN